MAAHVLIKDHCAEQQLDHVLFFFFNDTATTEIYTLSLHDALPISLGRLLRGHARPHQPRGHLGQQPAERPRDRKSTRLNSSHGYISYAVFCLKKKKSMSKVERSIPLKPQILT